MEPHKHIAPPKRKTGLRIALGVLLVLVIGVIAVAVWQKNNLEALKQYTQYTQEELDQQLKDNDQQVQDILNAALEQAQKVDRENGWVPIEKPTAPAETTEPTEPTKPITPVEPVITLPEQTTTQPPPESPVPTTPAPQTPTEQPEVPAPETPTPETPTVPETPVETGSTYEEQLQAIVDKVYALRAEYLQALDDLQAEAVAAYKAIPKSQRTKKALINFVSTYISKATTLEKQCDGKMDALVKELTALQKKYGQTMELVDAVKYTYANEKSLKKAWYMSELERRGLI